MANRDSPWMQSSATPSNNKLFSIGTRSSKSSLTTTPSRTSPTTTPTTTTTTTADNTQVLNKNRYEKAKRTRVSFQKIGKTMKRVITRYMSLDAGCVHYYDKLTSKKARGRYLFGPGMRVTVLESDELDEEADDMTCLRVQGLRRENGKERDPIVMFIPTLNEAKQWKGAMEYAKFLGTRREEVESEGSEDSDEGVEDSVASDDDGAAQAQAEDESRKEKEKETQELERKQKQQKEKEQALQKKKELKQQKKDKKKQDKLNKKKQARAAKVEAAKEKERLAALDEQERDETKGKDDNDNDGDGTTDTTTDTDTTDTTTDTAPPLSLQQKLFKLPTSPSFYQKVVLQTARHLKSLSEDLPDGMFRPNKAMQRRRKPGSRHRDDDDRTEVVRGILERFVGEVQPDLSRHAPVDLGRALLEGKEVYAWRTGPCHNRMCILTSLDFSIS